MRRPGFFTALLLVVPLCAPPSFAITRQAKQTGLTASGLKLGLNMATFIGSDAKLVGVLSPDSRLGLNIGGFMRLGFGPQMGLQIEALYSMKGAKYSAGGASVTFKYDYLEFPFLFVVNVTPQSTVVPNLLFGPAFAFKMSSKASDGTTTVDVSGIKSTDIGLVFGGGVTAAAGTGKLLFDIRYTLGMTKWDDSTPPAEIKNGVFSFNVGYSFR